MNAEAGKGREPRAESIARSAEGKRQRAKRIAQSEKKRKQTTLKKQHATRNI